LLPSGSVSYVSTGVYLTAGAGIAFSSQPGGATAATVAARVARDATAGNQTLLVFGGVAVITTTLGSVKLVAL
jgi:hypothetical protein